MLPQAWEFPSARAREYAYSGLYLYAALALDPLNPYTTFELPHEWPKQTTNDAVSTTSCSILRFIINLSPLPTSQSPLISPLTSSKSLSFSQQNFQDINCPLTALSLRILDSHSILPCSPFPAISDCRLQTLHAHIANIEIYLEDIQQEH